MGVCAVVYSTHVCVCSLPRFSADDVISYICICLWMSITSLIPLAARDARSELTPEASLEMKQRRQQPCLAQIMFEYYQRATENTF